MLASLQRRGRVQKVDVLGKHLLEKKETWERAGEHEIFRVWRAMARVERASRSAAPCGGARARAARGAARGARAWRSCGVT